jgi:hypothetical protein
MRAATVQCGLLLLLHSQAFAGPSQQPTSTFYVLEDAANQQWCAYSLEADWRNATEGGAEAFAQITFTRGRVSTIHHVQQGESGDWRVYDEYRVTNDRLTGLKRVTNVLPGSVHVEQVFTIGGGKAREGPITYADLDTNLPIPKSSIDWLPKTPDRQPH